MVVISILTYQHLWALEWNGLKKVTWGFLQVNTLIKYSEDPIEVTRWRLRGKWIPNVFQYGRLLAVSCIVDMLPSLLHLPPHDAGEMVPTDPS